MSPCDLAGPSQGHWKHSHQRCAQQLRRWPEGPKRGPLQGSRGPDFRWNVRSYGFKRFNYTTNPRHQTLNPRRGTGSDANEGARSDREHASSSCGGLAFRRAGIGCHGFQPHNQPHTQNPETSQGYRQRCPRRRAHRSRRWQRFSHTANPTHHTPNPSHTIKPKTQPQNQPHTPHPKP